MRRQSAFPRDSVETPAFIVRPAAIAASRDELVRLCGLAGCRALYSLKALGLPDVLHLMVPQLAGFSASSLFETLLVRHVIGQQVEVQVTSPGLRDRDCAELAQHCDTISFNSFKKNKLVHTHFTGNACEKSKRQFDNRVKSDETTNTGIHFFYRNCCMATTKSVHPSATFY